MATALTAEGRDLFSRHLLGDSPTTFPSGSWLSLHSAQPGNSGASQISSSRVAVGSWTWDPTNRWWTNSSPISVASVLGTVNWVALWHSAGSGNVWFEGQVASPFTMASSGSVLIPANALRIYATPVDGSNLGGLTDYTAQYVVGHFLGVSSWSMPSSFTERWHSASATHTGNANLSGSSGAVSQSFIYSTGNQFKGQAYLTSTSSHWSTTDGSGNASCSGTCVGSAWVNAGGGDPTNHVDFSGVDDDNSSVTYSSMRLSFNAIAGIGPGDVALGTLIVNTSATPTLIPSLRAPVMSVSCSATPLISVGSTSNFRGTVYCTCSAQIGDSAPGVGFGVEGLLYESTLTLQII